MPQSLLIPPMGIPKTGRHALVYFIPGNPGLIDYYEQFLSFLNTILMQIDPSVVYDIYGRSLCGFHDEDHVPFGKDGSEPFLVADQIDALYEDLAGRRIENSFDEERIGTPYDFVIIVGHSVGSYLTLELFKRHERDPKAAPHLNLRAGILLFPTIVHIAQSPKGRQMTRLRCIPGLAENLYLLAWLLLLLIPWGALAWMLRSWMGFSPRAAEVTADFLKSRDGVRQALTMGFDEMDVIREDLWDPDFWKMDVDDGPAADYPKGWDIPPEALGHVDPVKFYFLYAKDDHWVNTDIRNEWISQRRRNSTEKASAKDKERTEIVVERKGNIPHAFCTREYASYVVAGWVRDRIRKIEATMTPADDLTDDEGYEDDVSDGRIYWDDERVY
ncbi:hypothetical protein BROUX41_003245 [Berkeleyomyces rouxiae]|uniref:uncharacterized protein n=1 Tax=Berkeleyomyces rouxiae TaxID=2035830 RepID=UPI003B7A7165